MSGRTEASPRSGSAAAILLCLTPASRGQPMTTPLEAQALAPPGDLTEEITNTQQSHASAGAPARISTRRRAAPCPLGMSVYGMQVSGDQVHFGSFNGTIQPNGTVQMDWGKNWVIGRFDGPHFQDRWIAPACSYELSLDRGS